MEEKSKWIEVMVVSDKLGPSFTKKSVSLCRRKGFENKEPIFEVFNLNASLVNDQVHYDSDNLSNLTVVKTLNKEQVAECLKTRRDRAQRTIRPIDQGFFDFKYEDALKE